MILSAPEAEKIDLTGWKVIIGGSALPRAMAATALKRGIDIFTGYGMSETCPILTLSHLKADLVQNVGSGSETEIDYRVASGLNGNLVELEIVDEDMNPQPHDGHSVGEVVARGPSLTAGYSKNPEATATLWKGGWLHTGDIGAIDENGYLRVLDRSKDVIKTGGEWISSIGLEDIILRHPAISECAVIGIEDHRWGERPIAVVVLKEGATATEDEIKNTVRARTETGELSKYAVPDHIIFAQSLEKTSVGKLDKKKMRAMYGTVQAA
jgi:fatty-acyl-CoA synthase